MPCTSLQAVEFPAVLAHLREQLKEAQAQVHAAMAKAARLQRLLDGLEWAAAAAEQLQIKAERKASQGGGHCAVRWRRGCAATHRSRC